MDYTKLIIEMLKATDQEQQRLIYFYILALLGLGD